ncbi:MAG TPA: ribonuclease D [Polyangiaceae bacterium]|nr:ribonuclease D [Polyangiaceae bacterium]
MTEAGGGAVILVERAADLLAVAARCARAEAIALDVEANGLHAYRPKLCVMQLAWREGDEPRVAVIDPLATSPGPLAEVLSEAGPVKVLHDLAFDARMLEEAALPLGNVRDTSVAARLLGYTSSGLAALLDVELGIKLDKHFQQHDWSERPLRPDQLRYLANDVQYLLELDERLAEKARALDIEDEIAAECAYRLEASSKPPRDTRPTYVRVKGAAALDPAGRAVLKRLCEARDAAATRADVPPFKIVSNESLLALARVRPKTAGEVASRVGGGRAGRLAAAWLRAIEQGLLEGDVPEEERALFEPVRMERSVVARRKAIEGRVTGWRRAEAKRRGVDEQVVLPGHCAQALVGVLAGRDPGSPDLLEAIARIPGLGRKRFERYAGALSKLNEGIAGPAGDEGEAGVLAREGSAGGAIDGDGSPSDSGEPLG